MYMLQRGGELASFLGTTKQSMRITGKGLRPTAALSAEARDRRTFPRRSPGHGVLKENGRPWLLSRRGPDCASRHVKARTPDVEVCKLGAPPTSKRIGGPKLRRFWV